MPYPPRYSCRCWPSSWPTETTSRIAPEGRSGREQGPFLPGYLPLWVERGQGVRGEPQGQRDDPGSDWWCSAHDPARAEARKRVREG